MPLCAGREDRCGAVALWTMLNSPKTVASETAPMSGRTNSTNASAIDTRPFSRNQARSPAVLPRWNARATSMKPVVSAHAPTQMVSAKAVIPGHAGAPTPAAVESRASSSRPRTGPVLSPAKARAPSIAAPMHA